MVCLREDAQTNFNCGIDCAESAKTARFFAFFCCCWNKFYLNWFGVKLKKTKSVKKWINEISNYNEVWFWLSERITFIVIACESKKKKRKNELSCCIECDSWSWIETAKNTLDYNNILKARSRIGYFGFFVVVVFVLRWTLFQFFFYLSCLLLQILKIIYD